MSLDFDKYAQKGHEVVNRLAARLGRPDEKDRAGRILRSVLRALRNHLTVEESMQLMAQLPMALKSVYVDGWKPARQQRRIRNIDNLAGEVVGEEGSASWRDFSTRDEVVEAIHAVLGTLMDYVSEGEIEDILSVLPGQLSRDLRAWVEHEKR